MAIAPLIVAVRTTGAAQLTRLGISFRRLASNVRVAYNRFVIAGGLAGAASRGFNRLAHNVNQAARAMLRFAAATALSGLSSLLSGISNGLAKVGTFSAILGAKIFAVTAAVVPLVGVVGDLLPLLTLAAPAALGAAVGLATLKFAFEGVGKALKAAGDPKEFAEALKKLTPAAQSAVKTLVDLGREWKHTQKLVQESFFTGFRNDAIAASRAVQPLADKWLPKIAESFGRLRTFVAEGLARFAKDGRLEGVMRNLAIAFDDVARTADQFARAFGAALVPAAPILERMTSALATMATKFADWISEASKSGKLAEWLDKAVNTFNKLKEIASNLGGIIAGIFRGSEQGGQGFLDQMINMTAAIKDFINSANGQALVDFFATIIAAIISTKPAWDWLGAQLAFTRDLFSGIATAAQTAWDLVKTATLLAVAAIVGQLALIVTAAAKAFGWIPGIGPKLQEAAASVNSFVANVVGQLNRIPRDITVTVHTRVIGGSLLSAAQQSGTYSSGIGGRASGGPVMAGKTYRVGEQGPELVTFGANGYVHDAASSRQMMSGGGGLAGGGVEINLSAATNANNRLVREVARSLRVDVRRSGRGNAQRYWGSSGRR